MTQNSPATEGEIRRLTFIRYLLNLASEVARGPEPQCAAAVLTLHDAAELFLHLTAERFNVGKSGIDFLGYFSLIEKHAPNFAGRESMRRLNTSRRGLKHAGTRPARGEVLGHRDDTERFLRHNVSEVFGVSLEDVSLTDLITDAQVRSNLKAAEVAFGGGDTREARASLAIAFEWLLRRRTAPLKRLPVRVFRGVYSHRTPGIGREEPVLPRGVRDSIDGLLDAVEELQRRVHLLETGIDGGRLRRFRALVPRVVLHRNGEASIQWPPAQQGTEIDSRDFEVCREFVIDSALRLESLPTSDQ